jgi:hypothetical protein
VPNAQIVGCYDTLMNNLILMVLKKLGMPTTIASSLADLWDSTIHLIKTIYGTSTVTYGHTRETPLYGPGQGSMCRPPFWLLCYWLIVKSVYPTIKGATYVSACTSIVVKLTGVSFVDDTGLGITSTYIKDPNLSSAKNSRLEVQHTVENLRVIAQHWEQLLFMTEGALNLQKSFWYVMHLRGSSGKLKLSTVSQLPANLCLRAGYAPQTQSLPRIELTHHFWTLGVYLLPSGSHQKQIEILWNHSQNCWEAVKNSTLTAPEAWLSYSL